jgi:hypothetical protein
MTRKPTQASTSIQSQHRKNISKSAGGKLMKVRDDNAASVQPPEVTILKVRTCTPAIGSPLP